MGTERASKTRQREAGIVCCLCHTYLGKPPWHNPERFCSRCQPTFPVMMNFFSRGNDTGGEWVINFLEKDARTTIGRIRILRAEETVRDLIDRTPTRMVLAEKQALDYAFKMGRGCVHLALTAEQYRKLKQK